jgi:hypothetical protein
MNTRNEFRTLAASVIVLLLYSLAAAQSYQVRLERPWKVGERHRVSGTGFSSKRMTATAEGRVVSDQTEGFSVEFGMDETVLEYRTDGGIKKETLTVNSCVVRRNASAKQLLPKGTVIVADVEDGNKVFRINGQPVDKQVEEVLDAIGSISSGSVHESDDDVFGTREARKVGDTWSINSALAVRSLLEDKLLASEDDTKGTVTIEKKMTIGAEDCLVISGAMDIGLITGNIDMVKIDSGEMHARFSGAFPVDTSHDVVERSFQMNMRMSGRIKPNLNGPEIQVEVKAEKKTTSHYNRL